MKENQTTRAEALGAFFRGDSLSWNELQVVAAEAGISPDRLAELKVRDEADRLIQKYHLPLEVGGFSRGMAPEEEFRLYKGRKPGQALIQLNSEFWSKNSAVYGTEEFLTYLLFRAEAYFAYRSHYDAEHCAWIVEENLGPMESLKEEIEDSQVHWVIDMGPQTDRDLEFRKSLDPTGNPSRSLKALVEFSLRCIAQKAADNYAELRYRQELGLPPPLVKHHIQTRQRILADDFNRARSAMTRPERVTFQNLLKSPIRYTRQRGQPNSEPVFDPAPSQ